MPRNAGDRTVQHNLPPLSLRAAVRPGTVDAEARTAEIVWSTGARVLRGFFERYYEELSLDPDHVRMDRLNNGAPFLDSHNGFELSAVMGVVEKASVDGKEGTATIRFARAEDDENADRIFRKVEDGIIQNISVGYRVYRFEQVEGGDEEIPVFRAVDWEPFELSAVPMGADDGAGFRAALPDRTRYPENPCTFDTLSQELTMPKSHTETDTLAKRGRDAIIDDTLRVARIDDADFRAELLASDLTVDQIRTRVIDKAAERDDAIKTVSYVRVGDDRAELARRDGIANAIEHRLDSRVDLTDQGREFRGRSMIEIARMCLEAKGLRTAGMGRSEVAGVALGLTQRAGFHSTSDFPFILADAAGKTLRRAYMEAPGGLVSISRSTTAPDFKTVKRNQLGEAPALLKVVEGAEYTRGTVGEARELFALATFGRIFAVTRQAIINDDLSALERMPAQFGRASRDLERDLVTAEVTGNPDMGDDNPLFHASHGNTGTGVIGVPTLAAGRAAMRLQKDLGGALISVEPAYLVVPAALETAGEQILTELQAAAASEVNPFPKRLRLVVEPRLDAVDAEAWYLAADSGQIDTLEICRLEGAEEPYLESRVGFDVDGLELKARHDVAAKAIDWRGLWHSDRQAA